jgi:hypothetical protein
MIYLSSDYTIERLTNKQIDPSDRPGLLGERI